MSLCGGGCGSSPLIQFVVRLSCLAVLCAWHSVQATTVLAVPHSHDDVGWLKTPAQYYEGWNNTIQHASVRLIYNSVLDALREHPGRTFTVVEMAFFSKWFREKSADEQSVVQRLLSAGQLEFAGAGWCSHDEATTLYVDVLEQMTLGHEFVVDTFGVEFLPKSQWQVDPFGHGTVQAVLFSQDSGVDALFVSRMDYQEFVFRQEQQSREFLWSPSPSLGSKAVLLTSMMLHGSYCPPLDFNFDILLSEPAVQDAFCVAPLPSSSGAVQAHATASGCDDTQNTADSWVRRIGHMVASDAAVTRDDQVLWTMGCDFTYMQAATWFNAMDSIAELCRHSRATQSDPWLWNVSFAYATPSQYVEGKIRNGLRGVDLRTADMFPYADGPHAFWSGFYASRQPFKRLVRKASAWLGALRQLAVFFDLSEVSVGLLREALAQAQHHDAITGTAKQHVSFDYTKAITTAAANVTAQLSFALLGSTDDAGRAVSTSPFELCWLANESICGATTKSTSFHVFGWNWQTSTPDGEGPVESLSPLLLRIPVASSAIRFFINSSRSSSLTWSSVTVPSLCLPLPPGYSCAPYVALLKIVGLLPTSSFVVEGVPPVTELRPEAGDDSSGYAMSDSGVVETAAVKLIFNSTSGLLQSVENKKDGTRANVTATLCYYVGNQGDSASSQSSGAYIFRPTNDQLCHTVWNGSHSAPLRVLSATATTVVVLEQQPVPWLTLRWYIHDDSAVVDVEFSVTELPTASGSPNENEGRELVLRWETSVDNRDTWFTDANGLELMPRVTDARPFPFLQTEPIAGNYYPVTTAALVRDEAAEWLVLVEASTGCSSLRNGQLECMIHRRLLVDDGRGVGEPLNETENITPYVNCDWTRDCGQHFGPPIPLRGLYSVVLQRPSNQTWRRLAEAKYRQPLLLYRNGTAPVDGALLHPRMENVSQWWNVSSLPSTVELVSMEWVAVQPASPPAAQRSLWVRFAHRGSCFSNESCTAGAETVNFQHIFPSVRSVSRTVLTSWRKRWSVDGPTTVLLENSAVQADPSLVRPRGQLWNTTTSISRTSTSTEYIAVMFPMEIHAYLVTAIV